MAKKRKLSKGKATKRKATKPAPKRKRVPQPEPSKKLKPRTLESKLVGALEHAQDLALRAGYPTRLDIRRPVGRAEYAEDANKTQHGRRNYAGQWSWKSPWLLIGELQLRTPIGYADLYELLAAWDRASLNRRMDKFRIARIRVVYSDGGATDEYSLSETFAWSFALARAMGECDPSRDRSLAQRYAQSVVLKIIIWLSDEIRTMRVVR